MTRRRFSLLSFAGYVIGAVFAFMVFAAGATSLARTGSALQSQETQALGNIYAQFLMRVEEGARALRADYCARGKVETGPSCGDPGLLLGGPSETSAR